MASDQFNVRLDPRIRTAVERAVSEKGYPSISSYVVAALLLQLELDEIPVEGFEHPNPILNYFESERGKEILEEVMRRLLERQ